MKKLLIISLGILILSSCNAKQGIDADETNQNCEAKVLSKEQLTGLLLSKDIKGVQFIDIRNPHAYAIGHVPHAVNIPMKDFFNKNRFKEINKDDMLVLYGDDASTPKLIALLASHFKKGRFYTAGGGYPFIEKNILRGFGINSALYDDEIQLVDYQKAIDALKSSTGRTSATPVKKKEKSGKRRLWLKYMLIFEYIKLIDNDEKYKIYNGLCIPAVVVVM